MSAPDVAQQWVGECLYPHAYTAYTTLLPYTYPLFIHILRIHFNGEFSLFSPFSSEFGKYAGTEIELEGTKYLMMRQNDVLAIIG